MVKIKLILGASALLFSLTVNASQILFEHDGDYGSFYCSKCSDGWRVWDRFSLTNNAEVTQITALVDDNGAYAPELIHLESAHDIEFSIWDSTRENQIFAQAFLWDDLSPTPGRVSSDASVFDIFADISVSLSSGDYFLSIYDSGINTGISWAAQSTTVDGFSYQSFNADGTGILGGGTNRDMIFTVQGNYETEFPSPIPTPAAIWLFGIGLVGLVGFTRRRKAA